MCCQWLALIFLDGVKCCPVWVYGQSLDFSVCDRLRKTRGSSSSSRANKRPILLGFLEGRRGLGAKCGANCFLLAQVLKGACKGPRIFIVSAHAQSQAPLRPPDQDRDHPERHRWGEAQVAEPLH